MRYSHWYCGQLCIDFNASGAWSCLIWWKFAPFLQGINHIVQRTFFLQALLESFSLNMCSIASCENTATLCIVAIRNLFIWLFYSSIHITSSFETFIIAIILVTQQIIHYGLWGDYLETGGAQKAGRDLPEYGIVAACSQGSRAKGLQVGYSNTEKMYSAHHDWSRSCCNGSNW